MKKIKVFAIIMIMVMALTGSTPSNVEAKTKTIITVTNKTTGKKIGKKLSLKTGQKVQLKVKYGKKTVTKKAKYKTSAKTVAIVSKKGKITAKSAGTCTVKVTYKKKTKKIKVIVKEPIVNTEETTEAVTTEETKTKKNQNATPEEIAQFLETTKLNYVPHPECEHEWTPIYTSGSDVDVSGYGSGHVALNGWTDHITLYKLECFKCRSEAYTTSIKGTEAMRYTQEELANTIVNYVNKNGFSNPPKHKHQYQWEYMYEGNGRFFKQRVCTVCGWVPD